jgi:surfactin synthase thioesterase subunit
MENPNNSKKTSLIWLPFAGGSGYSFATLNQKLSTHFEVKTVELPGRGKRIREPLLTDMEAIIDDVLEQITDWIKEPYVLAGHSMGSLSAFLLTHQIQKKGLALPIHLFLSGRKAPAIPLNPPLTHLLPNEELKQKLRQLGGAPDEVLDSEQLFDFFEPILRADFQAVETWEYAAFPKLDLPVSVFAGTDDDMQESDLFAWQDEFVQNVYFQYLKGGHFYLFENEKNFVSALLDRIADVRQ